MPQQPITEQFLIVGKHGTSLKQLQNYMSEHGMEAVRPISAGVIIAEMPKDQPCPLFNNTASVYTSSDDRALTMHNHEQDVYEGIMRWRSSRRRTIS